MSIELIAEVASVHGGSTSRALRFIQDFSRAGVDTMKFQMTRAHRLKADDPQLEWFQRAELSNEQLLELAIQCAAYSVGFLCTVYHPDDVPALRAISDQVKVGSGEAHNGALADAIQRAKFKRVVVSRGIRPVHRLYGDLGADILACVSRYPCPTGIVGLQFNDPAVSGWSDHCIGLDGCMTAIALGARIIEKHVQLLTQARPPQPWEATVDEMATLREWADKDPVRFLGRWGK